MPMIVKIVAERFDTFTSVIIECNKSKYCSL